jgi:hypothetical protein
MQVIPFKRDEWKMNVSFEQTDSQLTSELQYKDIFHSKKSYS